MNYFFVKENAPITNGIELIFNSIADEYQGKVFNDFNEVLEFMEAFVKRITDFRNESYTGKHPKIWYAPSCPNRENWVDITIYVEGILTCKIIKSNEV